MKKSLSTIGLLYAYKHHFYLFIYLFLQAQILELFNLNWKSSCHGKYAAYWYLEWFSCN